MLAVYRIVLSAPICLRDGFDFRAGGKGLNDKPLKIYQRLKKQNPTQGRVLFLEINPIT
jgi:hypothetical protein